MATIQLRENQTYLANGELDPDSGTVVPNHYLVDGALWVTRTGQTIEEALVAPLAPAIAAYKLNRRKDYPTIGDQLDMLWHSIDADATLKSNYADFHTAIKTVKDANPKA